MKAKLKFLERSKLLEILPGETSLAEAQVLVDLRRNVGFTQQELTDIDYRVEPILDAEGKKTDKVQLRWDIAKDTGKEIEFGALELKMIRTALNTLDEQKKVTEAHVPLFKKFAE